MLITDFIYCNEFQKKSLMNDQLLTLEFERNFNESVSITQLYICENFADKTKRLKEQVLNLFHVIVKRLHTFLDWIKNSKSSYITVDDFNKSELKDIMVKRNIQDLEKTIVSFEKRGKHIVNQIAKAKDVQELGITDELIATWLSDITTEFNEISDGKIKSTEVKVFVERVKHLAETLVTSSEQVMKETDGMETTKIGQMIKVASGYKKLSDELTNSYKDLFKMFTSEPLKESVDYLFEEASDIPKKALGILAKIYDLIDSIMAFIDEIEKKFLLSINISLLERKLKKAEASGKVYTLKMDVERASDITYRWVENIEYRFKKYGTSPINATNDIPVKLNKKGTNMVANTKEFNDSLQLSEPVKINVSKVLSYYIKLKESSFNMKSILKALKRKINVDDLSNDEHTQELTLLLRDTRFVAKIVASQLRIITAGLLVWEKETDTSTK